MENRVFVLFCIIVALSFIFLGISIMILRLRAKFNLRILPILWLILFLTVTIPVTGGKCVAELDLFKNYTGGMRIEIHSANKDAENDDIPQIYIKYQVLSLMRSFCWAVLVCWFVLMTASFTFGLASYFDDIHYLTKNSLECHDAEIYEIFESARKKAGVKRRITLRIMKPELRISPCTCGIIFPSVYIGGNYLKDYSKLWLELVFIHELTHIKHNDTLTKLFTLAVTSFHTILPMSRLIRDAVNEDIEYLCDESVLDKMGDSLRGDYISMIIDVAERNLRENCRGAAILSCLSRGGDEILKRYNNMKARHDKKQNLIRVVPALILIAAAIINAAMMSSVAIKNIDNTGVDLVNPFIEAALCEYFGVNSPRELTENHLSNVYSIEFSRDQYIENLETDISSKYALSCIINEGFIWNGRESVPAVHPFNNMRSSYAILPYVIRADSLERRNDNSSVLYQPCDELSLENESVYILDPSITADEAAAFINTQYSSGQLELFLTNSKIIDTRDIALFTGLRTVIFSDKLQSSDELIYTSTEFAVITRNE